MNRQPWDLAATLVTATGNNFYQRGVRDNAKRVVRIKHMQVLEYEGHTYAALLLVLAESEYVDASYENMGTGEARTFPKEPGEGYRTESHLVVKLTPIMRGTTQVYPAVLEESPGLSPSVVISRLAGPIRIAAQREAPNAAGDAVRWSPEVELAGLLSASLIDEIARGELDAFDLIREISQPQGLDEPDELVQKRVTLHIDVKDHPEQSRVRGLIDRVRRMAREDHYSKVVIRYTEADTKKGKSAQLDVPETEEEELLPLEKAVARTTKITLTEPLNYDHVVVVEPLARQMMIRLHQEPQGG